MDNQGDVVETAKRVETIHVVVEFTRTDHRHIEFHTDHVTGLEIKIKAGAPPNSDLGKREHGKIDLIADNRVIEIKDGEHFVVLPVGSIS